MEILKDFGVQPVLLAAQVVNFLILLFILKRFLYGPILKVLEARKQRIEASLKNAEEIENKLSQANEKFEEILSLALKEAEKIIKESKDMGAQIIEESKQTAVEIVTKATEQALAVKRAEYMKLQQEVKENAAHLVAVAFEKVTGKKITSEEHKKIIEKEVKNLS